RRGPGPRVGAQPVARARATVGPVSRPDHPSRLLHQERMMDCSFPYCRREAATQLDMPICGPHARKVYQGVKDLLELQRAMYPHTAAKSTGTAERERNTKPGTVYFARCGDLIKIGYTTRLRQRMRDIGADEVLATAPGTINDEKA